MNLIHIARWAALSLTLLLSLSAHAIIDNPSLVPMGESEAMMGNTGFANSGSSGQVFYNPAGLAEIKSKRFTATGSTYYVFEGKAEITPGQEFKIGTIGTVPNLVLSARRLGDWTVGLAILTPVVLEINTKFGATAPGGVINITSEMHQREQETMAGLTAASQLGDGWSIGVSSFVHWYEKHELSANQIEPGTAPVQGSGARDVKIKVASVLAILGVQYRWDEKSTWGIRIITPNLELSGKAEVTTDQFLANLTGPVSVTRTNVSQRYGASYRMPLDIGTGVRLRGAGRGTFLADVAYAAPTDFERIDDDSNDNVKALGTVRANMGFSYRWSDDLEVLSGLVWNPSTTDRSPAGDPTASVSNFTGLTAGLMYHEDTVDSGFGVFYLNSRPDTSLFGPKASANQTSLYGALISASIRY